MALYQILLFCIFYEASQRRVPGKVNATVRSGVVFAACAYKKPSDVPNECYQKPTPCEKLTDPEWTADKGAADGKHDLFFAYGPDFMEHKQIAAWKYNPQSQKIEFWWSKHHCMGMTSSACTEGSSSNIPGCMMNGKMNPSSGGCFGSDTTYQVGATIKFASFGSYKLVKVGDMFRLQYNMCYLDHVYACSTTSIAKKFVDEKRRDCDSSGMPLYDDDDTGGGSPGGGVGGGGRVKCPPCQCSVEIAKADDVEVLFEQLQMYGYPLYVAMVFLVSVGIYRKCCH